MKTTIINYIGTSYPALCLVSREEQRAEAKMKQIAQALQYGLVFWI
jgi:hypothetical protein